MSGKKSTNGTATIPIDEFETLVNKNKKLERCLSEELVGLARDEEIYVRTTRFTQYTISALRSDLQSLDNRMESYFFNLRRLLQDKNFKDHK